MKNFIVFQERSIKMDYRIYQLDEEQKFYCSLTEKNMGFSVQKTIDYANNFHFFDTIEAVSYTHLTLPTILLV